MTTSMYDHNQNVYELQTALRHLRSTDKIITLVNPDGFFGPETTAAVIDAQRFFGLPQTGNVDLETWELLFDNLIGFYE